MVFLFFLLLQPYCMLLLHTALVPCKNLIVVLFSFLLLVATQEVVFCLLFCNVSDVDWMLLVVRMLSECWLFFCFHDFSNFLSSHHLTLLAPASLVISFDITPLPSMKFRSHLSSLVIISMEVTPESTHCDITRLLWWTCGMWHQGGVGHKSLVAASSHLLLLFKLLIVAFCFCYGRSRMIALLFFIFNVLTNKVVSFFLQSPSLPRLLAHCFAATKLIDLDQQEGVSC